MRQPPGRRQASAIVGKPPLACLKVGVGNPGAMRRGGSAGRATRTRRVNEPDGDILGSGYPSAPDEKGLINERTDYESGDDQGGSPTIFVTNMARAVAFYTEILGLRLQYRAGDHFAMIDAGDELSLGLHSPSKSAATPGTPGSIQVGLNVWKPLAQVVETLRSRGVRFSATRTRPDRRRRRRQTRVLQRS